MSVYISTFNPLRMEEHEILALATGREHLKDKLLLEMERCLKPQSNNHFLMHGPRGIGKSFFTKYLKIQCERLEPFKNSLFIQLPEEQSNLQFVGDLIDMLCAAIQNQSFQNVQAKWEVDDNAWRSSVKKLKQLIKEQKVDKPDFHVFFSMENLQDFIPQLDEIENGRLREFLEQFKDFSLIGTSVRPDLDNNYDKRLFQVFKKYTIKPWTIYDCLSYYDKRVDYLKQKSDFPLKDVELNRQKVKAISVFTGGSPRIAVILNRLVIEENIESVADTLRGIIDELTPYYQDLTKAMPPKTKLLFDTLIRHGENMTQSKLAELLGKQQNVISKPFRWLKENYYVKAVKQKQGNTYHYSVNDRMYALYWQRREMLNEGESMIAMLARFLFQFFGEKQMLEKAKEAIAKKSPIGNELLKFYFDDNESEWIEEMNDEDRKKYLIKREEDRLKEIEEHKLRIDELEEKVFNELSYYNYSGRVYLYYGRLLIRAENTVRLSYFEKAISNFENSLTIEENETALINMAYAKFYSGNIDEAVLYFKKSIKINPDYKYELIRLGGDMLINDRIEDAIILYETVTSIDSENYAVLIDTALLHFMMHNDEDGLEFLNKASKVNENIEKHCIEPTFTVNFLLTTICGKVLDNSLDRPRHEMFKVIMTILNFYKKEKFYPYDIVLQIFIRRLYVYDKKDLMFDIISEVRSSMDNENILFYFLKEMEIVLSEPNLLEIIDVLDEFSNKLHLDIYQYIISFLRLLKSTKERHESGKKLYL